MAFRFMSLLLLVAFIPLSVTGKCHPDDESGLLGIKSAISADPSGILSSWIPGTDCCKWAGISCRLEYRVTELTLGGQINDPKSFLSGSISPAISKLQFLVGIYFTDLRNLSGAFPEALFKLPNLAFIYISNSKLSGPIPVNIGRMSQLEAMSLAGNQFTGRIPDSISNLTELRQLSFSGNFLTGQVPAGIGLLKKLTLLNLEGNGLSGKLPELKAKGIESVSLSHNNFHLGVIPKWVASSPIIYSLKLASCGIKMKLDDWKPSQTYFYDFIDLSDNELSGSPVTLLNSTQYLKGFWISGNKLKFNMADLKLRSTLEDLDLSRNLISGTIPASVAGLKKLNVSNNHLCGKIPPTNFPASSFTGNDCLCGSPLASCPK